jgi:hypothetical protein
MPRVHTRSIVHGLAAAAGLLLSQIALAQLPTLQPEQRLRLPPDPAPQPPEDLPVRFGQRVYTDGSTAIVTVDQGRAAYAYVKNANGKWAYQDDLVVPAGYASSGASVHGNVALVEGVVDTAGATFVFYRTNGQWSYTQTLPGSNGPNSFGTAFAAIGEDYVAIGRPDFDGAKGGIAIYDAVGAGTYTYNTTLETQGASEGYLTGSFTQIDGGTVAAFTPGIGAVTVFVRNGGVWSQQALLTRTDGQVLGLFSLDNNRLVMAASGRAFDQATNPQIFVRRNGSWTFEQELVHPYDPQAHLDSSVALTGKRLVVGDTSSDTTFLYERNGSAWSAIAELPRAKALTCRLDSPNVSLSQVLAARGRLALAACASTPTGDPRFEGRVLVYQLPDLN